MKVAAGAEIMAMGIAIQKIAEVFFSAEEGVGWWVEVFVRAWYFGSHAF